MHTSVFITLFCMETASIASDVPRWINKNLYGLASKTLFDLYSNYTQTDHESMTFQRTLRLANWKLVKLLRGLVVATSLRNLSLPFAQEHGGVGNTSTYSQSALESLHSSSWLLLEWHSSTSLITDASSTTKTTSTTNLFVNVALQVFSATQRFCLILSLENINH